MFHSALISGRTTSEVSEWFMVLLSKFADRRTKNGEPATGKKQEKPV
jgi:hypothetical protein